MRRLTVTGESGRLTHELTDELVTIGRAPDNAIHLGDPSVSGKHAQLVAAGDTYHLVDLDSTNGTRVNGQPITRVTLRPGDQIRFGAIEARFECDVPAGHAEPLPVFAAAESLPAAVSARPADFANASPFPKRHREKDPTRNLIFAAAAVAMAALLASMLALAQMQAPPLP
jgi:pSer/pThr/pTyr-binding forkhead associated (FHA) protein